MYPILLSIGNLHVYTHGLLITVGAIVGGLVIYFLARSRNLPLEFLFDMLVFSLLGGILGARLLYIIIYYYQFTNWHEMFFVWYGGLVSFGGIAAGLGVAYLFLKKNHQNILEWFDLGVIGLMFAWAFGRIGCFLTGDIPGVVSNSRIAVFNQMPVALMESIWAFAIAFLLLSLTTRYEIFINNRNGLIFFLGLALYSIGRFGIDFYRLEKVLYVLKAGQFASLGILLLTSIVIYLLYFRSKGRESELEIER